MVLCGVPDLRPTPSRTNPLCERDVGDSKSVKAECRSLQASRTRYVRAGTMRAAIGRPLSQPAEQQKNPLETATVSTFCVRSKLFPSTVCGGPSCSLPAVCANAGPRRSEPRKHACLASMVFLLPILVTVWLLDIPVYLPNLPLYSTTILPFFSPRFPPPCVFRVSRNFLPVEPVCPLLPELDSRHGRGHRQCQEGDGSGR